MAVHLITGVAGFVGSTLADALLEAGETVRGVDCFTPYYGRDAKEANLAGARTSDRFSFHELDLRSGDLRPLVEGVDVIYHQAAQPGVRLSWSDSFETYDACNVLGTQRLLEAAREARIPRFVYASSSSVYGNAARYPVVETDLPFPHSPYGVTKLAAEHLCNLYASNYGMSTVSLRYFTVYGPRQRPDMAHHRLIESALDDRPFPLYGDGSHVRDFTFVGDVVRANLLSAAADVPPGTVINVCTAGSAVVTDLIDTVSDAVGRPVPIAQQPEQPGDVKRTGGCNDLAEDKLGWTPQVRLEAGIAAQVAWHLSLRRRASDRLSPSGKGQLVGEDDSDVG